MFKINIFKKIILFIICICSITMLLGYRGFASGFLVGSLVSVAAFSLMYKYVLAMRGLSDSSRKRFIIPRSLAIYFLMGIALFIGIKKGIPTFLGTLMGLLSLKAAIYLQSFQEKHAST